jgi:hypothetical protein
MSRKIAGYSGSDLNAKRKGKNRGPKLKEWQNKNKLNHKRRKLGTGGHLARSLRVKGMIEEINY